MFIETGRREREEDEKEKDVKKQGREA